jgi:hypothetical protein
MDIIMDIKRYRFMICKDIFFHSRYSRVYPFISFISSNLFTNIQLFIRLYPSFYPLISIHILFFYPDLYPYHWGGRRVHTFSHVSQKCA